MQVCPMCGSQVQYVQQYGQYFCQRCQQYVQPSQPQPQGPPPQQYHQPQSQQQYQPQPQQYQQPPPQGYQQPYGAPHAPAPPVTPIIMAAILFGMLAFIALAVASFTLSPIPAILVLVFGFLAIAFGAAGYKKDPKRAMVAIIEGVATIIITIIVAVIIIL